MDINDQKKNYLEKEREREREEVSLTVTATQKL